MEKTYLLLTRCFGLNNSVVRFRPMPSEKMCSLVRQAESVATDDVCGALMPKQSGMAALAGAYF